MDKARNESIVGKSEQEVKSILDVPIRVVSKDGESFILTCDYNPDRINLKIKNGKITEAYCG